MPNYRFDISFLGTNYHGWQFQNNLITVQGEIEKKLNLVLRTSGLKAIGCSRTDKGVHAKHFVFNTKIPFDIDESFIIYRLNSAINKDIKVFSIKKVEDDFNARFNAKGKIYSYRISFGKADPFYQEISYSLYPKDIDFSRVYKILHKFLGEHNFIGFASKEDYKTTVCTIESFEFEIKDGMVIFKIKANRFLKHMVRRIMGSLIYYAKGFIKEKDIDEFLMAKKTFPYSAKAKGLTLEKVFY